MILKDKRKAIIILPMEKVKRMKFAIVSFMMTSIIYHEAFIKNF